MIDSKVCVRTVVSWFLVGSLSGLLPLSAAQQPGTLADSSAAAPHRLISPSRDLSQIAPFPRIAQESEPRGSTGASAQTTHHISRWVWVAIITAVGVGVGVGVVAGNSQSGKTAATTTSATLGAGSGGITAGAP